MARAGPLQCLGAALHISCLSAANGPRVMMKRFTEQKGREGDTQRQGEEREARAGGGGGGKKMKGQIQIRAASVWQRM